MAKTISAYSKCVLVVVSVGLLVSLLAVTAWAWGGGGGHPHNPNRNPGPAHCPTGRRGGHNKGGCKTGGKPTDEINTYTGELTITDMPVYYQAVGGGFPFVLNWNLQSTRTGTMGSRWTNSYNVFVIDEGASGATVVEGNGWEHGFDLVSGVYVAQASVFDNLVKLSPFTGWELTRPDNTKVNFNTSGQFTKYTNSDGFYWTLAYSGGNLSTVTDPLSRVTSFTYTSGKLTRVTVPVPGELHADFTYDANGRLSTITDATTTDAYIFGYSGTDTKIVSLTDPSRQVRYYYGTFNGKTVVDHTDINGLSGSTVYYDFTAQANGQLFVDITETKDGVNRITRHIHENTDDPANGRYFGTLLSTVVDAGGLALTEAWAYDSELRMVRHRDSYSPETGGKAHRHFYYYTDSSNPDKVTKYIDPENSDANPSDTGTPSANCPGYLYQYDGRGNKIKETTPEGRVTDYSYYANSDRLYQVIIRDEDVNGNPVARTTTYTYYPSDDPAVYQRYQLKTVTDARANVTTYYYDSNGYLDYTVQSGDPNGYLTDYTANDVGDIIAVQDPNVHTTSYQYDGLHRQTQITYPDVGAGQKTKITDWSCCGMDSVTDENGRVTYYEYDQYTHNLWKVHEDYGGLNYATEYSYDEVGNLKTETNARGKVTTYTYDDADRKTRADYPDSTYETWTYRDDGRVYQHTDGRGRTTTYRYDADDRLAGSGSYVAINYQSAGDTDVKITRDDDGLITRVFDAGGTTENTYYPSTWLKTRFVGGPTSTTLTYEYNGVGLVSHLTMPDDSTFDYVYNSRNLLSSVTNPDSVQITFTYDDGGRRTDVTRPGSGIHYDYNARDWITAVQNRAGGVTRYDASYYYSDGALWDHTGNPLKRVENFGGSDFTTTLRYDNVYRQTEETKRDSGGNTVYTLGYGYDQAGNRTSLNKDGTAYTFVYDDNNKMTSASGGGQSASFGYDGSGNMTSVTGTMYQNKTLVYNDESRLASIAYGGVTDTYTYNWQGLRTRAYLAGTYYRYIYNGERVLQDLSDAGAVNATYTTENDSYYGTLLHLQRASGESRFPLYDEIGSARGLVDASGTVTDTYDMDTFGRPLSSSGSTPNPYRYGAAWGYITDPSGLLQLGARYYWPEVGRFVQQDPVRPGAFLPAPDSGVHHVVAVRRAEPNSYLYGGDNPVTRLDPTGLQCNPFGQALSRLMTCAGECAVPMGTFALGGVASAVSCVLCSQAPNPWSCRACAASLGLTVYGLVQSFRCLRDCMRRHPMPDPCEIEQQYERH